MTTVAGCSAFQSGSRTKVIAHNTSSEEIELMVSITNVDEDNKGPLPISEVVVILPGEQSTLTKSVPPYNGHLVTISAKETADQPADVDIRLNQQTTWEKVDTPLHAILHPEEVVFTVEPDW